jgi:hypothetical protein
MRLVVIEAGIKKYRVFEGNKCIAEFDTVEGAPLLDKEQVEELRIANFDEKA